MKENYSVFVMEHRGHVRSIRLGIVSSQISVEKFDYYVEDFKRFIDEIVIPNSSNKNLFLFAHSMGGGIGTLFLEEYTNYFTAAVLSSPMHEINTGKAPKILANIVSRGLRILGKGKDYLPGQVPYAKKKASPTRATSCKERYEYLLEKIKKHDEYQSGGSSALWYIEGMKAARKLVKKENSSKVRIPVLLLQAEYDSHVIPEAQKKFSQYAKNCKLVKVNGSKHESYYERDEIAFSVFDKILSFYSKNV